MANEKKTKNIKKYQKLIESFLRIINHYTIIEKEPKKYGTDEFFHKLEIHTIHAIGENLGINVTKLAKWHGITKSAVSQVVKTLEERDLIYRYQAPDNAKEVLFKLTEKGKKAYEGHKHYHEKLDAFLIEEIEKISEDKYQFLLDFFKMLEKNLKNHSENK